MSEEPEPQKAVVKASVMARFPWVRFSLFLLTCGFLVFVYKGYKQGYRVLLNKGVLTKGVEVAEATLEPNRADLEDVGRAAITELEKSKTSSRRVIRQTSKGVTLETSFTLNQGGAATDERTSDDSYYARCELIVNLPTASSTLEALHQVNPDLGAVLPDLGEMLETATVSPYFKELYERKIDRMKSKSSDLDDLLTRHNLYDCEAILNLTHPETGRRVLLVQAEMDVVSDGSDGDRLPTMPEDITTSSYYQPMTSYGWKKTGNTPNPLIAGWRARIGKAKVEIALPSTRSDRRSWLKERIKKIQREIDDMESRSFLVADYDPFIVMPVGMVTSSDDSYFARVGDYAAVIYNDRIYPAIVGDAGPSYKVGEASLRMSKELNPTANSYRRPVSDLSVTYLVFPRSADDFSEPDYSSWHTQCSQLLTEIGGLGEGVELHQWKNTFPVKEPTITSVPISSSEEALDLPDGVSTVEDE